MKTTSINFPPLPEPAEIFPHKDYYSTAQLIEYADKAVKQSIEWGAYIDRTIHQSIQWRDIRLLPEAHQVPRGVHHILLYNIHDCHIAIYLTTSDLDVWINTFEEELSISLWTHWFKIPSPV